MFFRVRRKKKAKSEKRKVKISVAVANSSFFILHSSFKFVPLQRFNSN